MRIGDRGLNDEISFQRAMTDNEIDKLCRIVV